MFRLHTKKKKQKARPFLFMVSRSRIHSLFEQICLYFIEHMLQTDSNSRNFFTKSHIFMWYTFISHIQTKNGTTYLNIFVIGYIEDQLIIQKIFFCNMLCMRNRQNVCVSSLLLCAYAMFCTVCSTFCICCKCQRRRSYHPTLRVGILLNTFVHNIFVVSP